MKRDRLDIQADRNIRRNCVDVFLTMENTDGGLAIAEPIVFRSLTSEERQACTWNRPTLELRYEDAQCLMDELWRCGLRPTEGSGSAGSLAATEKHLNDMRAIVSKQLEVKL